MLDINLDHLESFQALSKYLNITQAAHELGYTQQALSYQISQLEERLNAVLFKRSSQGVTLTDAGRNLLRELPVFVELLSQTRIHLEQFSDQGSPTKLQVFFSNGWDCDYLSSLFFEQLALQLPKVKLELSWCLQEQLLGLLLEHQNSVALGYLPLPDKTVQTYELYRSPAVLAAHSDYETEPPLIEFNQEHVYPFSKVLKDLHYDYSLDHILGPRLPKTSLVVNSIAEYKALGVQKKGTLFTHYRAIEDALLDNTLKVFEWFPEIECKGYISWNKTRETRPEGVHLMRLFRSLVDLNPIKGLEQSSRAKGA